MSEHSHFNKFFIALGVFALFIIPELNNVHYDPQPQFWAEITLAWVVLGIFTFTVFRFKVLYIPSIVIPLFLFSIYLILQQRFVLIEFPGLSYVTALELLFCIIIAMTVNTIKATLGSRFLVRVICLAILWGGLLQSLIGLIQYLGAPHYFGDLIFYDSAHPTTNIFGHFGQRNHYAHYLSWAVFGLIYLHHQKRISAKLFYPLILWFCFSLTIAASRSVFIYFALGTLISAGFWLYKRNLESRKLFILILISSVFLVSVEYFYPIIHQLFTTKHNFSSGLERLANDNNTGRRGVEWAKAWLTFKSNPIFGAGWNEYAKESVKLFHLFPKTPLNSGLFTNCHNLILQLLAETGLIGTLIVVIGLIVVICRILISARTIENIILLCMAGTTLSHSMNEYPLWYMYFLIGLVVFLSVDKPVAKIPVNKIFKLGITIPICGLVYLLVINSIIFDKMVSYYDTPDDKKSFNPQAKYLQNLVDNNPLWSYHAIYTLDNYINADTKLTNQLYPLQTQYDYIKRFCDFHPYPDTLIKEGMLAWNLDKKSLAESLIQTATLAFPVYSDSYKTSLKHNKYRILYKLIPNNTK